MLLNFMNLIVNELLSECSSKLTLQRFHCSSYLGNERAVRSSKASQLPDDKHLCFNNYNVNYTLSLSKELCKCNLYANIT